MTPEQKAAFVLAQISLLNLEILSGENMDDS